MGSQPLSALEAIHTAARRYCLEHAGTAFERARAHPDAWGWAARARLLEGLRAAIEVALPEEFGSEAALRDWLAETARVAEPFEPAPEDEPGAEALADEERELFRRFVQTVSVPELRGLRPLPHRRTLEAAERDLVWARAARRWGLDGGYWHPLVDRPLPSDVAVFRAARFALALPPEALRALLARRGVERLCAFPEWGPAYELARESFAPACTHAEGEGYWTGREADWLIYACHEGAIAVAGGWLLAALKAAWPEWEAARF